MNDADTIRCETCGRPCATDDDWKTYGPGEGVHLCWDGRDARCVPVDAGALLARVEQAEQERDSLMADTWRAFVEAGGDPDGNHRWHCDPEMAGRRLLDAVRSLREDYDACMDCACNRSPVSGQATHPATKDHK